MINWLSEHQDQVVCAAKDGHKTENGRFACHISEIGSDGPTAWFELFCDEGHVFRLELSNQKAGVGFRVIDCKDWTDRADGGSRPAKLNSTPQKG